MSIICWVRASGFPGRCSTPAPLSARSLSSPSTRTAPPASSTTASCRGSREDEETQKFHKIPLDFPDAKFYNTEKARGKTYAKQFPLPPADRLPVREPTSLTTLAGCPNCQGVKANEQRSELLPQAAQARHSPQGESFVPAWRRGACASVGARSHGALF